MYRACRHIKPNGLRCQSPALRQTYFCYYHSKLHSLGAEPADRFGPMRLPVPEGPAAIQLSIAKITDALITGRIDPKRAGQLLYAMQIASQHLESHSALEVEKQVQTTTTTPEGEELAPEEFMCEDDEECDDCPCADECNRLYEASGKSGKIHDDGEDDEAARHEDDGED